MFCSGFR